MATTLFLTHPRFLEHVAAPGHPERPARLSAVCDGAKEADVVDGLVPIEPRLASRSEVERVHSTAYLDAVERLCAEGGGWVDPETGVNDVSFEAAMLAAGAGLTAIERLDRGEGDSAFCAVRPPGHHATPASGMGFCIVNNVAVAARALADRGERVLIVDYDAHHGNGTQAVFEEDPDVAYVSFHEYPLYPWTGRLDEVGTGAGAGTTLNFPFPAGTTGDVYRAALDDVVAPFAEDFAPTWLLLSAGFDAHRRDPLTGLGLAAGDFADLTRELVGLVPAGHRLVFLEGGYDLEALRDSTASCLGALAGLAVRPEPATTGGPGAEIVVAAARLQSELSDVVPTPQEH